MEFFEDFCRCVKFFSQKQKQRGALWPLFSALVGIYEVMSLHKTSLLFTLVPYEHKQWNNEAEETLPGQ